MPAPDRGDLKTFSIALLYPTIYWLMFRVSVTPLLLVSVTPEPRFSVVSAVTFKETVVAAGPVDPLPPEVLFPPPHELMHEIASIVIALRKAERRRLLCVPHTTKASTGGTENGKLPNGRCSTCEY